MAHRRCCCERVLPPTCKIFEDKFERVSVGSDWTQEIGTWGISGGKLVPTALAGTSTSSLGSSLTARIRCNYTVPVDVGSATGSPSSYDHYLVYVKLAFTADHDIAVVEINNGTSYLEVERLSSGSGQMRLYNDGVCCASRTISLYSAGVSFTICSDGDKFHATIGGSSLVTFPGVAITSSIVHLGVKTCVGTVSFDEFSLYQHQHDMASCPKCDDEGCIWFDCYPQANGVSISDKDFSVGVPGNWTYFYEGWWAGSKGIKCTGDDTLSLVVQNPYPNKSKFEFSLDLRGLGYVGTGTATSGGTPKVTVTLAMDGGRIQVVTEIYERTYITGMYGEYTTTYVVHLTKFYKDGILHGYPWGTDYAWLEGDSATGGTYSASPVLSICLDEYRASALGGSALHVPASDDITITISGLQPGQFLILNNIYGTKHKDDVAVTSCAECFDWCVACDQNSMPQTAVVTLTNVQHNFYDEHCCTTDTTGTGTGPYQVVFQCKPLGSYFEFGHEDCWWSGTTVLCGQRWNLLICIAPYSGILGEGWSVYIELQHFCQSDIGSSILAKWYEVYIPSGSSTSTGPPACLSVFNGDIARIYGVPYAWWPDAYMQCLEHCNFAAAACDLQFYAAT